VADARSYHFVFALRALTATDGMTADYILFPHEFVAVPPPVSSARSAASNRAVSD
jgi:GMP synthase PP-ATPase subunit